MSKPTEKARREHDEWLMKMGAHPSQRKRQKRERLKHVDTVSRVAHIPSSELIPGFVSKKRVNAYTGNVVIGIATMHKSNSVPVTSKKAAEEISKMRRN